MMLAAPAALLALGLASAPAFAGMDPADNLPADDESLANEFSASIERLSGLDAQSPNTLNARLAYADFQSKRIGGQCSAQLDAAQKQLDLVAANPALPLLLPSGLARAAAVDYQIHLGRSSCEAGPEIYTRELRAALESAKRSKDLYHDGFDAVAMAAMQFNVAVTYHGLNETGSALAALQAAIDIDREYGFGDDAEDNYRLLLEWNKQPYGDDDVAARMQDFPERSATLIFGWTQSDSDVTLLTDISLLADGEPARIQSFRSAQRQVRKGTDSWVVNYQPGEANIDLTPLGSKRASVEETANLLARILTELHDFVLARNGNFDDTRGGFNFSARVRADSKLLKTRIDSMGSTGPQLARLFGDAIRAAMSPDALASQAAENYNLGAGTWIGAELAQGVWYPMMAQLSLPLGPEVFVDHKIQFAYTRPVPCQPESEVASCIEIVLRAAPDPEVVKPLLDKLARAARLPRKQIPQLWSVTEMRLVTDPKTLQPYSRETRRHAYWWTGARGPDQSLIESVSSVESLAPIAPKAAQR